MKKILLLLGLILSIIKFTAAQDKLYHLYATNYNSHPAILGVEGNIHDIFLEYNLPIGSINKYFLREPYKIRTYNYNVPGSGIRYSSDDPLVEFIFDISQNSIVEYHRSLNSSPPVFNVSHDFIIEEIPRTGLKIEANSVNNNICNSEIVKISVPHYFNNETNSVFDNVNSIDYYIASSPDFQDHSCACPGGYFYTDRQLLKANGGQTIYLTSADIPAQFGSPYGKTFYIQAIQNGNELREITYRPIVFYPSFPTPETRTPTAPLCATGTGSISLSNFKYDDGTVYNGGENLSIVLTNQATGIPDAPIIFSGTSINVPSLSPGQYKAQINSGSVTCTNEFTFAIPDAPPVISAIITGQNPDCASGTGTITATGNGGTPPYQYALNGGSYQSSNIFTGLAAGSYNVQITDANNCGAAISNSVNITNPLAVNTVLNAKINPTGYGMSNGQIIVSANGGSGTGYTYSIDGVTYLSSDTFSGLAAGNYNIKTKDSKGCESDALAVVLSEPTQLNLSVSNQINNSCFGGSNGSVDIIASGGTTPYLYAIDGGTLQTSPTFNNLIAGIHTISVKDFAGIEVNLQVNVLQPDAIVVNITGQNPECAADGGTITANASGGTAPYKYSLNGGSYQSLNTFSNLVAGVYSVTTTDAKNCNVATSNAVTISVPNPVNLSLSFKNDPTGFNATDGKIVVVAGGGSSTNFTYTIDDQNYFTSATFSSLAAGTYLLKAKDGNGCISNVLSVTLNQPNQFSINVNSKTDIKCFGDNTGAVTVSANGGVGPYLYSINGGKYESANTFTGLTAGNYTLTAKDDHDYEVSTTITIIQPQQIVVSITAQNPDCNVGKGILTAIATGGTAPYRYALNGGTFQSSNVFSGLGSGNYTVTVTDVNNCAPPVSNAVNIIVPNPVLVVLSYQNNPTSVGGSNGQIAVSASGGSNTGYTYAINGSPYNASNIFSGLVAGTYNIIAKDGNSCASTGLSVTLTDNQQLSLNVTSKTDNSCFAASSGSATVIGSGGLAPYQYSLDGGAYQSSGTFANLAAANYTVTVRDANNGTANISVIVSQPAAITATITKTDAICFGGIGSIVINNPTGGSGSGFLFSINNGTTYQSSNVFSASVGNYLVKIKDSNGCISAATTIIISQPSNPLQVSVVTQDVKCYGLSSGIVTLTASGGSGGYVFTKDNFISSNTTGIFSGLMAGNYDFKVKDQLGCISSLVVIVKQPEELILHIDNKTNASCFGGLGSITVSATGGEGIATYSSTPSLAFSNGVFSGAVAGVYDIKVIDGNGCIKIQQVTISQPNQLLASATITAVTCNGANDGKVVLNPSGGTGSYTYAIKNTGNFNPSNTFLSLSAGHHVFTVKDQNGCTVDISAEITQPDQIVLQVYNKQDVVCNGEANGSFTINARGGNGDFTYKLNGADKGIVNNFNNLFPGNYVVTVTDRIGCYKEVIVNIVEPALLSLSLQNKTDIKCFGSNTGSILVSAAGGSGTRSYALNGGNDQASPLFANLIAGNYIVSVKDANQCIKTLSVNLIEPQQLTASFLKDDVKCFGDASGKIIVAASGGNGPYLYSVNGTSFQLNNEFPGLIAGTYSILVQDNNNCQFSGQVTINHVTSKLNLALAANSPLTCNDTGSIIITSINGGVSPYSFSIDGTNYDNKQTFSGLASGTYTVFAKDANGCIVTQSETISIPSGISAQFVATAASCFLSNTGIITINNATGGNGNYLYSLNGGDFQSANHFDALSAGNYVVVIKDSPYTCSYTLNVNISEPAKLNLELKSKSDISCNNGKDGKMEVLANGGTLPYQYSVDNGITFNSSGLFKDLPAKNYIVLVKDKQNCTQSLALPLTEPTTLAVVLTNKTDVNCYGAGNGTVAVNATGGTSPYQYSINGGIYQSSNQFISLSGGNYIISVRDANGCNANLSTVVNENSPLKINVQSYKNLTCNSNGSGEITLAATGGDGNYLYSINNGSYQAAPVFQNLGAGVYVLSVKDGASCLASISQLISEPVVLQLSKTIKQQKCFDACDGEIILAVSGGTQPYTYQWSGNFGNVASANNLCGGLYRVKITDANGCFIEDQTEILTPQEIKISNLPDTVLCVGQVVTYDAGNPGFTYLWTADNGFSKTTQKVQISDGGKYNLKVTNLMGCSVSKTFNVQTSSTLLKANFLVSTYANVGDTIIVVDVSQPTPAKTSWIFDTGTTLIGGNATNSIKQVTFNSPGVYNMMVMVNLGECADAIQKSITVLPKEQKSQVNNALGYKESLFKEFKVFPNPTNGQFKAFIKLSEKMDIKISMYGFTGGLILSPQKLANSDVYEVDFNQTQITPGIYVLTVEAGTQVKTFKILKL